MHKPDDGKKLEPGTRVRVMSEWSGFYRKTGTIVTRPRNWFTAQQEYKAAVHLDGKGIIPFRWDELLVLETDEGKYMNTVNYEFCTVTLASEWLGVSRQTIYAWVKDGRIAYVPGEKLFYARDLDLIRHERIVEAAKGLEALQDIPTLA